MIFEELADVLIEYLWKMNASTSDSIRKVFKTNEFKRLLEKLGMDKRVAFLDEYVGRELNNGLIYISSSSLKNRLVMLKRGFIKRNPQALRFVEDFISEEEGVKTDSREEECASSTTFTGASGMTGSAEELLEQAAKVMRERAKQYDQEGGERSLPSVVEAFNAITGHNITESDAALFMVILKLVRGRNGAHVDSAIDGVAYMALYGEAAINGNSKDK